MVSRSTEASSVSYDYQIEGTDSDIDYSSIGFFDDEIDIMKSSLIDKFPTMYDNI